MRIAPAAALLTCLLPIAAWAQQASPVGRWRSIDDATGKPKAVIEIQEAGNGTLTARIVQVLDTKDGPNPLCTACEGKRRNQPIVGMHIAWGLKPQGKAWGGGRILDPENGKEYSVKMTPIAAGRKLEVRGFIGMALLGRTQVWMRE
ncbi:DUF2147 domain-containing protein [Lysobacter brunescens]|uniref:DUF2147 domain-containing protein n=1 Tax=Lysobacter brunescens TaxID=262323 RepID=A0ABW2YE87_9GAMM